MPGISHHTQQLKPRSEKDTTGLIAVIVVLVLLVVGGSAAYLLIRWHFAKQRAKAAAAAGADCVGREEGKQSLRGSGIPTAASEKDIRTQVRQRSVGGTTGDGGTSEGNTTSKGVGKGDTWI